MSKKNRKVDVRTAKMSSKRIKDVEELVLPVSKLKFSSEQLQNLNFIFTKKLDEEYEPEYSKAVLLAKSITERLIQRLLCGVGLMDRRFASKFLVSLHDDSIFSEELDYLVRLDYLSTPKLHATDYTPKYTIVEGNDGNRLAGYAEVRLHQPWCLDWHEFVNAKGYLRRDKVQEKMVELLSVAASSDVPDSPLTVDESLVCGSPGKIMDALTLHQVLHIPPEKHVFYGPSGNTPRFPNPRDYTLAIVDDPSGIRIRVGFHSPALSSICIDVRLLIAIGLDAWPSSSTFPLRVPLGHSDCVLYYKAAQTGMYLVGYGIQSIGWQIRLPAAECTLESNYGPNSTVRRIFLTLLSVLREIKEDHRRYQISHRILHAYSLRSALFSHLEDDQSTPTKVTLNWSPKYLSTHVLTVMDHLVRVLRKQKQPNYFFPQANVLVNPGHWTEDDYAIESNRVKAMMLRFLDESVAPLRRNVNFTKFLNDQHVEMALIGKWKALIDGLTPPPSTRRMRISFTGSPLRRESVFTQYSTRQLEYIGLTLKHLLLVRQNTLLVGDGLYWVEHLNLFNLHEDSVEDVIYILVTVIQQARDRYLECLPEATSRNLDKAKLKRQMDIDTSKLVEQVRKEKEVATKGYADDTTLVKIILRWLYKGLDYTYLARVLRPYLRVIFLASHGASWHLEAIKNEEFHAEIKALGVFAKLVNFGRITPAQGLVDAVAKNWNWAKGIMKTIEAENLRLNFVSSRSKSCRHILALPSRPASSRSKLCYSHAQTTMASKDSSNPILLKLRSKGEKPSVGDSFQPPHNVLKNLSPLNQTIKDSRRMGEYRCLGNIFESIVAMNKLNILQEVSALLPYEEDRLETLEAIQKLTNEKARQTFNKKKCNAFVQLSNSKRKINPEETPPPLENRQRYTPMEESAGIREVITVVDSAEGAEEKRLINVDRLGIEKGLKRDKGTLIGSCRAARIRQDASVEDYFQVWPRKERSSFKY